MSGATRKTVYANVGPTDGSEVGRVVGETMERLREWANRQRVVIVRWEIDEPALGPEGQALVARITAVCE